MTADTRSEHYAQPYYGWWVLAATAITEMLAIGSTSYAGGLFVLPVEQELHLSRADASSAIPILFAGGAIASPLVGAALDRYPIQWLLSLGALALGAAFAVISVTSSPLVMGAALFIPAAIGFVAIGPLATSTIASRWFYRRRGLAFGIASLATSGGGLLVVPFLSLAIASYGWRTALALDAVIVTLIVTALALLVVRDRPGDLDLDTHPENRNRPPLEFSPRNGSEMRWTNRRILSDRDFWLLASLLAIIPGIDQALVISIVPYATAVGINPPSVAFLITGFSVSAAGAKIASGLLSDWFDPRSVIVSGTLAMCACMALLVSSDHYAAMFFACCLGGVALGCTLPSCSALVANRFGPPCFGTVMGWIYVGVGFASIASVRLAGMVFDRTGEYTGAFFAFLAISIVMVFLAVATRLRQPLSSPR